MHVPLRRAVVLAGAIGLAAVLVLLVAAMAVPVGWLKGMVERRLTDRFDRPVTIAGMTREHALTLTPVVRISGLRVPQAAWAGKGDLIAIDRLSVRVRLLPLLIGRLQPELLAASGVHFDLIRAADGRESWRRPSTPPREAGVEGPDIDVQGPIDGRVRYRDALQNRSAEMAFRIDPARGLTARGAGVVDGAPVTLTVRGGRIQPGRAWPFQARIDGAALSMRAVGAMTRPLAIRHMTFKAAARADDLKRIDRVIESGLFGSQPVALTADVRRDVDKWAVERLTGTIGQSDISGRVLVDKVGGRNKIDGDLHSRRMDLDDLSPDADLAQAIALERRIGPRIVPNSPVNLAKIDTTDGRLAFQIDRIFSRRGPSSLKSASGVFTLDHQRLVTHPLRIALTKGIITGTGTIDQRGGAGEPIVTLALDLHRSSIGALTAGQAGEVDAPVEGRVRLTGRGSTLREAVGRSSGTIGLVARDGSLPAKLASLIGFDFGRAVTTGESARAGLRCAVLRLQMRNGIGRMTPLIVDTSRSQTRGQGTIRFPQEVIAATLTGAPKSDSLLRLPGSITAGGTILDPRVTVPREVKSIGNVLKGLGRALSGRQEPIAADADCAALSRQAIGR